MPANTPPDLRTDEAAVCRLLQSLRPAEPPPELEARILAAAEPGVGSRLFARLAAVAAAFLLGFGAHVFARAASAVDADARAPQMAVVQDAGVPLYERLEPAGSLGPDDEVVLDAGR